MERAKKECILDSAVKAFAKLGFKKASVDDIARDAGVAKGTVYLACESKEDLFFQAGNHHEIVLMRRREYERIAKLHRATHCLHRDLVPATSTSG